MMECDVMIYMDGSEVVADDGSSNTIRGSFDQVLTFLESSPRTIFIKKGATPYYQLSEHHFPVGTFFYSNLAKIDIQAVNGVAFTFGDPNTVNYMQFVDYNTGLRNLRFIGNEANCNTWIAVIYNAPANAVFDHVHSLACYNGLAIYGQCYCAMIDTCSVFHAHGTAIRLQNLVVKGIGQAPNATTITHCDIESPSTSPGACAIENLCSPEWPNSDTGAPITVLVDDVYIEGYNIGIWDEGCNTEIRSSEISIINGKAIYTRKPSSVGTNAAAIYCNVHDNTIYLAGNSACCGVHIDSGELYPISISNNDIFVAGSGTGVKTGIHSTESSIATIQNNRFSFLDSAITGKYADSDISHNLVRGSKSKTQRGLNVTNATRCMVSENRMSAVLYPISGSWTHSMIINNIIKSPATFSGSNNVVYNNG